jgi:hypothetical protein
MTIRPIDMQVLIPKASELHKINPAQDIHSQIQQQQFAAQFQQVVQNRQNKVQSSHQTEGQRIGKERDSQRRGHHGHAQQEKPDENQENTKDTPLKYPNPILGNHIDIKT